MKPDESVTVVYVEDDERIAQLTAKFLTSHGVHVVLVTRGDVALSEILLVRPDVVLLDLILPGMNGLEICEELRKHVDVPIIMVSARTDEADRVMCLEGGADDYVSKPFSARELLARIRAQTRRARRKAGPRALVLKIGPFAIDAQTMSASLAGRPLELTTHEFSLLRALCERPGRVLTRQQILELVHGSADDAFDRSIDVQICRLRQKLGDDSRTPRFVKTVRGIGYLLAVEER